MDHHTADADIYCAHAAGEKSILGQHRISTDPTLLTMQGLPWRPTSAEPGHDEELWETTIAGTRAVCDILAVVRNPAMPTRTAVLPDGTWDAAMQRVR